MSTSSFSKKTSEIQSVLTRWDAQGWIPGDALCCVTSLTKGMGVIVSEATLASWQFSGTVTVGDSAGTSLTSLDALSRLVLRPSEIFMVRGAEILGAWDVWVYAREHSREYQIAVSLL